MLNVERLIHELKRDEGLRLTPYRDTRGYWTIGYGHCLGRELPEHHVTFHGITDEIAEKLLWADIVEASAEVAELAEKHGIDWKSLSDVRQRVLINMAFNLGISGLNKFKLMWGCIAKEDYLGASLEMLNSRWVRQVGDRARRLAEMMDEQD